MKSDVILADVYKIISSSYSVLVVVMVQQIFLKKKIFLYIMYYVELNA